MKNQKGYTAVELLLVVVLVAIVPALIWTISLWTDRNLDFWMTYFKGEAIDVPMWISVIVTIVLNGAAIAGNIIGELLRLLVG